MSKREREQAIDDIIEMVATLPDETIDEILATEKEYTGEEALDEVTRIAKEHGEHVKED